MNVRETIADYIEELSGETIVDHSSNLFQSGLLTSLDVLSLVAFVEDTFALKITDDDVDMESFGSIDGLVSLVMSKQGQLVR